MIKKHKHYTNKTAIKLTVTAGYVLFGAWLLATIVGTIVPWSSLLFAPGVRHVNVITIMLSFTAASIAPPLIAYILADTATRGNNRLLHHYNGVLLGIGSFLLVLFFTHINAWLVLPFDSFLDDSLSSIVLALTPATLTIIIMVGLVLHYAITQKTKQRSLLEHIPYQILLIGSVIGTIIYYLSVQLYSADTVPIITLMYVVIPTLLVGISYAALVHQKARLASAILATSLLFIAITVMSQLLSTVLVSLLAVLAACVTAWLVYLRAMYRSNGM